MLKPSIAKARSGQFDPGFRYPEVRASSRASKDDPPRRCNTLASGMIVAVAHRSRVHPRSGIECASRPRPTCEARPKTGERLRVTGLAVVLKVAPLL
jgi:hypothetical protein